MTSILLKIQKVLKLQMSKLFDWHHVRMKRKGKMRFTSPHPLKSSFLRSWAPHDALTLCKISEKNDPFLRYAKSEKGRQSKADNLGSKIFLLKTYLHWSHLGLDCFFQSLDILFHSCNLFFGLR